MNAYTFVGLPPIQQLRIKRSFRHDEIKSKSIIDAVCNELFVTFYELKGKSRKRELVVARQICIYHIRKMTTITLKEIGIMFNRDHATVMHSVKNYEDMYGFNKYFTNCANLVNHQLL